jgi:hypothetical protein
MTEEIVSEQDFVQLLKWLDENYGTVPLTWRYTEDLQVRVQWHDDSVKLWYWLDQGILSSHDTPNLPENW